MYSLPMNKWYVSRWLRSADMHDFIEAIDGMTQDLEALTGSKFDLKIAFYKASRQFDERGNPVKPDVLQKEVTSLHDLSPQLWNKATYVEATLTARPQEGQSPSSSLHYDFAKVSAKWPDPRRISFHVEPEKDGREICQRTLGTRFPLWTQGLDY